MVRYIYDNCKGNPIDTLSFMNEMHSHGYISYEKKNQMNIAAKLKEKIDSSPRHEFLIMPMSLYKKWCFVLNQLSPTDFMVALQIH